ncbi:MAG TPA: SRPBCC family protein [Verrucomicrobiae bacterium]|nr:SRPBCC family protein [Verrucomicrobiae bacterium]
MLANLDSQPLDVRKNRQRLAQGLGWFSIGLGLAEFLAPRTVCSLIGVKPNVRLMRLLGLRELATGAGLLTQPDKEPWLTARVAGDAMDLGVLGIAAAADGAKPLRLTGATLAVSGVMVLDYLCRQETQARPLPGTSKFSAHADVFHFRRSIVVNRPPAQLYQSWRDFTSLPRFMQNLLSVEPRDNHRWHWIAKGPGGTQVEWDAEVIEDRPNESIAWRSLPGSDVEHTGSVRFEPAAGNRGTIVRVEMEYRPPAGKPGGLLAKLLGRSPEKQIASDLLRFKQLLETGEIARTEGQPAGRMRSTSRKFDELVRA